MGYVPKKTLQALGQKLKTPKKSKVKSISKGIEKSTKLKPADAYYYSVSGDKLKRDY